MVTALVPEHIDVKDFTDDRLADVLRYLGDDATCAEIETRLRQRLIRVQALTNGRLRVDSTTAAMLPRASLGDHDVEGTTLFRHGHSKDHRPDLAQFRVMLGALDPLGLPIATLVVPDTPSGRADDGLHPLGVPIISRTRHVVGLGRLYIGDTKMAALTTRVSLEANDNYYLVPLLRTGNVPDLLEELLIPVWSGKRALQPITVLDENGESGDMLIALGCETTRSQVAEVDGASMTWDERLLLVFSPTLIKQQRRGLAQRLDHAE